MRRFTRISVIAGAAVTVAGLCTGVAAASPVPSRTPGAPGIAAPPVIAAGYFAVPEPGGAPALPADFGSMDFKGIVVTDSLGVSGGLANPAWHTGKLTDPFSPRAVAGPLHTSPAPPHSEFTDTWVP